METEHLIEQTIETIRRASAIAELGNGQPQETLTPEDVAGIVDWVLREVSNALKGALVSEIERARWWNDPSRDGHIEWFRGGITEDYPLPRQKKDGPE